MKVPKNTKKILSFVKIYKEIEELELKTDQSRNYSWSTFYLATYICVFIFNPLSTLTNNFIQNSNFKRPDKYEIIA